MRLLTLKGPKMDPPPFPSKNIERVRKKKQYLVAMAEYALFKEITIPCLAMHDCFSS
jgi:hypothetical protein